MKVCPLITQAAILEEAEKELLVREADNNDLDKHDEENVEENGDKETLDASDVIQLGFKDSGTHQAAGRSVRFLAKSYRGSVECLGELCRFHDDETDKCRLDKMMDQIVSPGSIDGTALKAIKEDVQKSWEFQQQSTSDILGFFKELEQKSSDLFDNMKKSFEKKLKEITKQISSATEENKKVIESITETITGKTDEIEKKFESGEQHLASLREDVVDWKSALEKNLNTLESEVEASKDLVSELSENHSEIVKLVENQKESLEEEEKKRMLSEARRLNNSGVIAYHSGQYEKAQELFNKAIELEPDFTEGYNNLGLTYTEINEEDKATDAFKKAIELDPDLPATYNNLGYVFYRLGSYNEAIEMYNEAIGRCKNNSSAYTNLGNAYYKLDRIEEAIEAWQKAVEIDPGNEKARRNLKRFHAEVQDTSE